MPLAIVNDYVTATRIELFIDEDGISEVKEHWNKSDTLLAGLQKAPLFAGKTTWGELEPIHYRLLIAMNIGELVGNEEDDDDLDEDEDEEDASDALDSLAFLIKAFVYSLQIRSSSKIESIKFNRVGDIELVVDFSASIIDTLGLEEVDNVSPLKVVVSND